MKNNYWNIKAYDPPQVKKKIKNDCGYFTRSEFFSKNKIRILAIIMSFIASGIIATGLGIGLSSMSSYLY